MIDIEKLAKENGFIPSAYADGECYADLETLKQFAEAYTAKVLEDKEREIAELKTTVRSDNSKVIAALNAHINDLCEALEKAKPVYTTSKDAAVRKGFCMSGSVKHYIIDSHLLQQTLSKTPAQSLQEHNRKVVLRCKEFNDRRGGISDSDVEEILGGDV